MEIDEAHSVAAMWREGDRAPTRGDSVDALLALDAAVARVRELAETAQHDVALGYGNAGELASDVLRALDGET